MASHIVPSPQARPDPSRDTALPAPTAVAAAPRRRTGKPASQVLDHAVVEQDLDAVVVADAAGRIVVVNRQTEALFGYTRRELLGRPLELLLPEGVHAAHRAPRHTDVAPPRIRPMGAHRRVPGRRRDGSTFPVEIALSSPSGEEDGRAPMVICTIRDAGGAPRGREAAEAARAADERLRLFVENVPAAVAMLDRDLRYLAASRRWRQLYQLGEDFLGRRHYDLFPDVPERWKEIHRRCLDGAVETSDQDRLERGDGSIQWLRWEVHPWFARPGEVGGIVIYNEDLTERLRLEQEREAALRRSEEWFRGMANTAPVLLWVAGTDALVTFVNAPWLQFTGRQLEQELGNGWAEGVHPDDYQRCLETYLAAFQARQAFTMAYRLRRHDGEYRWVLDNGVPRFAPDGAFEGYIGSAIDITEPELLKQEREAARAQELAAREVARQLDQFFAMAAHDIRSPITALTGNVELAQLRAERLVAALQAHGEPEAQLLDRVVTALDSARTSGEALTRLTSLLFDVAQARSGTLAVHLAPLDLTALVREQVATLRAAVHDRVIHLGLPERLIQVLGDADRLGQVLDNYVTNAVKYSADDQPITVCLEVADGRAVVSVRDAGPGLASEEQSRVWEQFRRVPGVEARGHAGSPGSLGLGLYICKRLIERHQGQVGVESVVGQGSTFWFALPLAGVSAGPAAADR